LSILTSILAISLLGETINIKTLGGLALAVGILVDDATVTIENIERVRIERRNAVQDVYDPLMDLFHWAKPRRDDSVASCLCPRTGYTNMPHPAFPQGDRRLGSGGVAWCPG